MKRGKYESQHFILYFFVYENLNEDKISIMTVQGQTQTICTPSFKPKVFPRGMIIIIIVIIITNTIMF